MLFYPTFHVFASLILSGCREDSELDLSENLNAIWACKAPCSVLSNEEQHQELTECRLKTTHTRRKSTIKVETASPTHAAVPEHCDTHLSTIHGQLHQEVSILIEYGRISPLNQGHSRLSRPKTQPRGGLSNIPVIQNAFKSAHSLKKPQDKLYSSFRKKSCF